MIIYGLGNNEVKYLDTRHNVGRLVTEGLCGGKFSTKQSYMYAKDNNFYYLLSSGYMNNSGSPLVEFINYFKIIDEMLLVVQDDSDLHEGSVKIVQGGGAGGHRGIQSIYNHIVSAKIDNNNIWRVRIGIRPIQNTEKSETFVLKNNSQIITKIVSELVKDLKSLFEYSEDMIKIQQEINSKY